jgi:hypothetical protein
VSVDASRMISSIILKWFCRMALFSSDRRPVADDDFPGGDRPGVVVGEVPLLAGAGVGGIKFVTGACARAARASASSQEPAGIGKQRPSSASEGGGRYDGSNKSPDPCGRQNVLSCGTRAVSSSCLLISDIASGGRSCWLSPETSGRIKGGGGRTKCGWRAGGSGESSLNNGSCDLERAGIVDVATCGCNAARRDPARRIKP